LRDVINLANQLGIDLRTDKEEYMWFIKQALQSLLPKDWIKEESRGRTYYHNKNMLITT
jgi:NTP pyrophosphatase (non-canonical NTP hydrolase)